MAAYRALAATWRVSFHDRALLESGLESGVVLALWHGEQLPVVQAHAHLGVVGMASESRDGELLAQVISRLGYGLIRGSTSGGGVAALRASLAALRAGASPALAVDGPRGPWRVPHLGALALSAMSQRPIVFAVSASRPAIYLRSWDRFVVPLPLARVVIAYGQFSPPADRRRATLQQAQQALTVQMRSLSARLEAELAISPGGATAR